MHARTRRRGITSTPKAKLQRNVLLLDTGIGRAHSAGLPQRVQQNICNHREPLGQRAHGKPVGLAEAGVDEVIDWIGFYNHSYVCELMRGRSFGIQLAVSPIVDHPGQFKPRIAARQRAAPASAAN